MWFYQPLIVMAHFHTTFLQFITGVLQEFASAQLDSDWTIATPWFFIFCSHSYVWDYCLDASWAHLFQALAVGQVTSHLSSEYFGFLMSSWSTRRPLQIPNHHLSTVSTRCIMGKHLYFGLIWKDMVSEVLWFFQMKLGKPVMLPSSF